MSKSDYLTSNTVDELGGEKKLIFVNKNDSLVSVLKVLVENNILSCPVTRHDVNELNESDVLGIVSLMDLVVYLVERIYEPKNNISASLRDLFEEAERRQMATTPVSSFIDASERTPFLYVKQGTTVFDTLKLMLERGAHRLLVLDENGKITKYVTQSSIMSFLYNGMVHFTEHVNKTLSQAGLAEKKHVYCVTTRQKAWEAFKLMSDKRITAVGVVDEHGKLVGNISHRDIRMVKDEAQGLERLHNQVSAFLIKMQREFGSPQEVVVCKPDETIFSVMEKLHKHNIHRIYVVDEHKRPLRIVTMTDLFHLFLGL